MKRKSLSKYNKALMERAFRWAVQKLGLQAWTIHLILQPDVPSDWTDVDPRAMGTTRASINRKQAEVWVSVEKSLENDEAPINSLFHELLHIAFHEACCPHESIVATEFVINRLADLIEMAWHAENP